MVAHAPGVKRYPMALDSAIRGRLLRASSPEERDHIRKQYGRKFRRRPGLAYRPAPTARCFHACQDRIRFLLGGNRSGKSRSSAQEVLWFATGTHPYRKINVPNVGWYSTVSWEMVGSVLWASLQPLIKGFEWRVRSWVNKGRNIPYAVEVRVKGGWSVIMFKSYEQGRESYQGTERAWICNDEQFPPDIFEEQMSRIGPGDDLEFWAPMTPIDPQPWLEERLTVDRPDGWGIFEMPIDENRISRGGVIPDHRIDEAILNWPEEMRNTRRLGKWSSFLGAVFKSFNRDTHVISAEDEKSLLKWAKGGKIHGSLVSCGGVDFGGNNPFCYLIILQLPDDEWYVLDEYYWEYRIKGNRLLREHAQAIKDMNAKWGVNPPNIWADHDKQDRMELEADGVMTMPADKGQRKSTLQETGVRAASGKRQLIETIQTLLTVVRRTRRPRLMIAARCKNLIKQMIGHRWPEGTDTKDPADLPLKIDDHAIDAMEYGIHTQRVAFGQRSPILLEPDPQIVVGDGTIDLSFGG